MENTMNMKKLSMTNRTLDAIKTHLEVSAPYAAGGFLLGTSNHSNQQAEVIDFVPALNVIEGMPNTFKYNSGDLSTVESIAQARDLEVIGFYASKNSASISLDELFVNERRLGAVYLIATLAKNELTKVDLICSGSEDVEPCSLLISEALAV